VKDKLLRSTVVLLFVAIFSPSFALGQPAHKNSTQPTERKSSTARTNDTKRPPANTKTTTPADIKLDIQEALEIIERNYAGGTKLDYNEVFKSSIVGMLRTLDPHSNYFDRKEFEELRADQRSEYYGIGASIVNQFIKDGFHTYITATFEGSPAFRAGLRYGDRIAQVNGEDMAGKPSSEVRDKIRGPRGSRVTLTLERAETGKLETVELRRDVVPQPSVPDFYMLKPGIGYIDMTRGFNFDTAESLDYALDYLRSQGMTSLILDLRNNPGGLLDQSVIIASRFLRKGQLVVSQKGRKPYNDRTLRVSDDETDQTPLVVLVNRYSASASEIVSGALQDHDRALIVGENTFGKGLVQSIIPLDYGSGLTLTSAKYYTPSGRLIQRDYSNGNLYDYYNTRGANNGEQKPTGPESKTDTGRIVYSGGGITPDVLVAPPEITSAHVRLRFPIFFFTRELVNGRISGFDAYKVQNSIEFNHRIESKEFPITDGLLQSFKNFIGKDASWKANASTVDKYRDYVATELRFNIALAAYGRVTADQVYVATDPQVAKAVEVLPQARELSMNAQRAVKKGQ
jgi:carboxyl-terminal processing protease